MDSVIIHSLRTKFVVQMFVHYWQLLNHRQQRAALSLKSRT